MLVEASEKYRLLLIFGNGLKQGIGIILFSISFTITLYCSFLAQTVANDVGAMYKADSTLIMGRMYEDKKIMMVLMQYIGNFLIIKIEINF